jgi:two-component system sensor histidine kinase KdpD
VSQAVLRGRFATPRLQARRLAWKVPARARGYLLALACSGVALLLSVRFANFDDDIALLVFLTSVAATAAGGGLGPALLATAIGFASLDLFFESPRFLIEVSDPRTSIDLIAFLVVSVALGSVNAKLRSARQRADVARLEAEKALLARDEALAIVSHDLRTPLTAIKTAISTVRNPGTPLAEMTRLELLGTIEAEADRLVHFVGDALALSRLQAGVSPDRQWNALDEVVSAALDRSGAILGERPITFDVPDNLPLARFDAGLLAQALGNLLENVGVHTPSGAAVSITGRIERGTLRLEVSDAGPGIPSEARDRVFNKFERLHEHGPGAGLGLAIARAATEVQGGQLRIEDSPLGGARFVLLLPDVVPAEAA